MKKARHKRRSRSERETFITGRPRFSYTGDADGYLTFWRYRNRFDWEPIKIDREKAKAFVDYLNTLTGTDINKIGGPYCDKFIAEARASAGGD